jgi:hypothetical protein
MCIYTYIYIYIYIYLTKVQCFLTFLLFWCMLYTKWNAQVWRTYLLSFDTYVCLCNPSHSEYKILPHIWYYNTVLTGNSLKFLPSQFLPPLTPTEQTVFWCFSSDSFSFLFFLKEGSCWFCYVSRLALNSRSSCLSFLSAGIIDVCHLAPASGSGVRLLALGIVLTVTHTL